MDTNQSIRTKITEVTPALAKKWLKKNTSNRHLREGYVERLADDMTQGRWLLTHQGIAFNCDGTLLDGQHRLHAIIKANVGQRMLVTSGLPRETIAAIDDHCKRSVGDSLTLAHGIKSPNLLREVSAAAAMERGMGSGKTRSRQAQVAFYKKHEKAIRWAATEFNVTKRGLCRAPVLAVIARAWYTVDREKLAKFCAVLKTGVAKKKGDEVVVKLRDWLLQAPSAGYSFQVEAYRKTERVVAAYLKGQVLDKIYEVTVELFPIPGEEKAAA